MKLRKTLYAVLCLVAGVCTLSGCIEEYEADIPSEDSDLLVVEGTISSSQLNRFVLFRAQALNSSDIPWMIAGAKVSVRGSDGSEYVTQAAGGYYTCRIGPLAPDVEYWLHIEAEGEIYESEPQKPLPTEKIADVQGVQNTPGSNIDVLVTPEEPFDPSKPNYYSWTYDETWEVHPDYTTFVYFDIEKMEVVHQGGIYPERGWKDASGSTISVGASTSYGGQHIRRLKIYDLDCSNERVYHRYSGLVHQRAISKAEYEYEMARRQAGSEMGGLFTPLPSALPTNLHCLTSHKRVIGYVGCSLNTSDYRFFLNAKDFSVYKPHVDSRYWVENPTEEDLRRLVKSNLYLCDWNDEREIGGPLRTSWVHIYQLDVRYKGAYIEKPVFWSLQENVSY